MSELLGALDLANIGAPVRVLFDTAVPEDQNCPGKLRSVSTLKEPAARQSLERARDYTAVVVGWPTQRDVVWTLESPDGRVLPDPVGPSLFGTFCLGLMQLMAVEQAGAGHGWCECLTAEMRNTPLHRVAVSAAFDPKHGSFIPVGAIELKLTGLGRLNRDACALCVVARGQPIKLPRTESNSDAGFFTVTTALRDLIVVVEADDPMDAFRKLFKLQARGLARHFLR